MSIADGDSVFRDDVAKVYESYLVPLIFAPYAVDIAQRLATRNVTRVLEIAAGTGVVTRALASTLPSSVSIVATDLNQAMLDEAATKNTFRPVEWRQADAMQLPFADGSFDAVVCQFGVMFFPDRAGAFAEVRRVLAPGGVFLFNAWDRIEENEFPGEVTKALGKLFPDDPPRFMIRTPHGYYDVATIARDLADGGFTETPSTTTIAVRSRAASARDVAIAFCLGTPLRDEIASRAPGGLEGVVDVVTTALVERFGAGSVEGKIQAHIVTVERV